MIRHQLELRRGDVGEVIELVSATSAGRQCAIRFANGYEIETVLPTSITAFLDEHPSQLQRARYVPWR